MPIVELPIQRMQDQIGEHGIDDAFFECQKLLERWRAFKNHSQYMIDVLMDESHMRIDATFSASFVAYGGLAFIYRNPFVQERVLPYAQINPTTRESEPRELQPGYALVLNEVQVNLVSDYDDAPIRVTGEDEAGLLVVTFEDFQHEARHYLELERDPRQDR